MRVFAGIPFDPVVRSTLRSASQEAQKQFPGRYVPMENYHCTLAFMGDMQLEQLSLMKEALEEAAREASPFSVTLTGLSFFRHPDNCVLFCALSESKPLQSLAIGVRQSLEKRKLPFDPAPFAAHVTLARHARVQREKLSQIQVEAAIAQVNCIALFESRREGESLKYLPLITCPLQPNGNI